MPAHGDLAVYAATRFALAPAVRRWSTPWLADSLARPGAMGWSADGFVRLASALWYRSADRAAGPADGERLCRCPCLAGPFDADSEMRRCGPWPPRPQHGPKLAARRDHTVTTARTWLPAERTGCWFNAITPTGDHFTRNVCHFEQPRAATVAPGARTVLVRASLGHELEGAA